MLRASFPPPDRANLGIDDQTNVHEAAFREHARGRIRLWERVRPDRAHAGLAAREVNQRAGGFGRVSPPFARGHDAIGDLHHTVGIGLTLESRTADDLPAGLLDDEEAVTPRIRAPALLRDMAQRLEPLQGDLPRHVEPPQSI